MNNIERQKLYDRDHFSYEDRARVADKSQWRCARCGKKIKNHDGLSIDHYIPLSKGGNNRMINLIPLCVDCNEEKGNKILDPDRYLKYLDDKYMEELRGYFESYIMSFEYITRNTLLACDEYEFYVCPPSILGGSYNKSFKKAIKSTKVPVVLKKAQENDFDKILKYYIKALRKYDQLEDEYTANKNISFWMMFGSIYYVEKNGEIQTMACVTMQDFPDYETMEKECDDGVNKSFVMIIFSYYSTEMVELITESLARELPIIIMHERNLNCIPVNIQFLKDDKMGCRIASRMSKTFINANMIEVNILCTKTGTDEVRVDEDKDLQQFFSKFKDIRKDIKLWFSVHDPYGNLTWMANDIIWGYSCESTKEEADDTNRKT